MPKSSTSQQLLLLTKYDLNMQNSVVRHKSVTPTCDKVSLKIQNSAHN